MKITILGYSGSGKSTIARKLGEFYNIPVLHIDTVYWIKNWQVRDYDDQLHIVDNFMNTNRSWVIDGNYRKIYQERRIEEADLIILMLFNRFSCLYRALKRYFKYRNKTRPDMGNGCNEKIDWNFVKWILFDGRTKDKKCHYKCIENEYKDKCVVIKNQRQLDKFTRTVEKMLSIR